jgi:hypothetical protein
MKYRDLKGAITSAKFVYALVQYTPGHTFYTKVSKEAAREMADEGRAKGVTTFAASKDAGDLYIGVEPAGLEGDDHDDDQQDDDE